MKFGLRLTTVLLALTAFASASVFKLASVEDQQLNSLVLQVNKQLRLVSDASGLHFHGFCTYCLLVSNDPKTETYCTLPRCTPKELKKIDTYVLAAIGDDYSELLNENSTEQTLSIKTGDKSIHLERASN